MLLGNCALVFQKETSEIIVTQFWSGRIPTTPVEPAKRLMGRCA
jgi:hypothetical protein